MLVNHVSTLRVSRLQSHMCLKTASLYVDFFTLFAFNEKQAIFKNRKYLRKEFIGTSWLARCLNRSNK